jgi:hypothetical protein
MSGELERKKKGIPTALKVLLWLSRLLDNFVVMQSSASVVHFSST